MQPTNFRPGKISEVHNAGVCRWTDQIIMPVLTKGVCNYCNWQICGMMMRAGGDHYSIDQN